MNEEKLRVIRTLRNAMSHASTQTLRNHGLNEFDIHFLVHNGMMERVKRGLYRWIDLDYNEMVEVSLIVPAGVFCLYSAFAYWELSTHIPKQYTLAVPRESHIPALPSYPSIKVMKFTGARFTTGIADERVGNDIVSIYDLEKTVCDAVIHRNRIGLDLVKEILEKYVSRPDKNIRHLTSYSRLLRVYGPIKTYLEVML